LRMIEMHNSKLMITNNTDNDHTSVTFVRKTAHTSQQIHNSS
jgi:hypothetical protein